MTVPPTDLLGDWALERSIEDRHAGERRRVLGYTHLVRESGTRVRWSERGTMTWSGHTVEIGRTLYVERRGSGPGAAWWVLFEDGRDFHPWRPGLPVDHPCGADHYRGLVALAELPARWSVRWDVAGPGKDYTMRTVHTPAG